MSERHEYQHEAICCRSPTILIPKDPLGISEDEIARNSIRDIKISDRAVRLDSRVS